MIDLLKQLLDIGFSENEAKAYMALLRESPCTAYELSKNASIPTSKIYEVLGRLSERGVITEVEEKDKKKVVPLPPDDMLDQYQSKLDDTLASLRKGLKSINNEGDLSTIWNIRDYDVLMNKADRLIRETKSSVLISCWPEELGKLEPYIKQAVERGVKSSVVLFGKGSIQSAQLFLHPIEDTVYTEKGGRGLVIIRDSEEVLFGNIGKDRSVSGANSRNPGFTTMAEDFVKHDIYIMKIIKRFDELLIEKFGVNYELLRDVYSDGEAK